MHLFGKVCSEFPKFLWCFLLLCACRYCELPQSVTIETEQMLFHSSLDMQHLEIGVKSMNSEIGKT